MLPITPCPHVQILPVSADSSMGLPGTSSSPNPHWNTQSDFFAQCITFCIVYELRTPCLSLPAPMPRITLFSSTLVISSSFRYQLNPHPQTPSKNNLNSSNIINYILLSFVTLCTCPWHLSQLQFTFSCIITSLMSASLSRTISAIKARHQQVFCSINVHILNEVQYLDCNRYLIDIS